MSPAVRPDWKAAAWLLERKKPARYGTRVQVAGDVDAPIPVRVSAPGLTPADKERRAAEVLRALSGLGADPVFDAIPVDKLTQPTTGT